MSRTNPNKVSHLLIFSLSSIAIFVLLYLTLGRQIFKYTQKVKSEFKGKQLKLQDSQDLIRSLPNPQKAIEEIEKKVLEFKEMGLTKKQLPRLIQLLGQAANERNTNVLSIKPREDIKANNENLPTGVAKIYMEIVVNGDYKSVVEYVKSLGELPVSFTLESLSLAKKEEIPAVGESKSAGKNIVEHVEIQAILLVSTYLVWEL
jgi:Tfp pilus assembly protein PilO